MDVVYTACIFQVYNVTLCMCSGMQTSFMFVSSQVEGELDKTPHLTVETVQSIVSVEKLN